jgi:hypothetical protein
MKYINNVSGDWNITIIPPFPGPTGSVVSIKLDTNNKAHLFYPGHQAGKSILNYGHE